MLIIKNIKIKTENGYLTTVNLKRFVGLELKLLLGKQEQKQYIALLTYLINYFIDYKPVINDGQTIAYHSWLLKFVIVANSIINLHEVQPDGKGFVEGGDHAIKVIIDQQQECIKYDIIPLFPLFSQLIVISEGVFDGKDIDAVRYPSPNNMTGWWLTTELYDGDISSLQTIHYYHVVFKRPDLIKYLALPFGFRILTGEPEKIWFDEKVLL
ncbi:hypothetical protein KXD93_19870 [Mucilaginibacter sp. BJC16-A38]|uniref:immunity protein Imm33 domain-containing protein n=1 Tax=Mucilaginibacter phenanthrenivorans TaxID=1234842 RepID=UPI0021576D24|nr:hypothetical protein [Mucilaginibacter phenanthrenivorans]MCR8559919.1 hypothetical protein [Mucilaginibacter phenanthrenivorans]